MCLSSKGSPAALFVASAGTAGITTEASGFSEPVTIQAVFCGYVRFPVNRLQRAEMIGSAISSVPFKPNSSFLQFPQPTRPP